MLGFGGNINRGRGPIGIAVGSSDVCLAQRDGRGGYVFARERFLNPIQPTSPDYHAETARAIGTALRLVKFVGKQSVSALPVQTLQYKTLRLPPMPPEDLREAIAWEAADRFKINEDHSLQHYAAGEVHQGDETREEVILLAADRSMVYDHATAIKRAGLVPIAIDATGAALARLLGESSQSALIVHLGEQVAEVVGVRDRRVIFDKTINLTIHQGDLDITGAARELALCLRYLSVTFGIHRPDAAWLSGLHATPAIVEQLSDALHASFKTVDQSPRLEGIGFPESDPSPWLVALGLTTRGVTGQAQRGAA